MVAKKLPTVPSARPGTMASQADMGVIRQQRPQIDHNICNLCRECLLYCPDAALAIKNDKIMVNMSFCKGCGICANECHNGVITMKPEYAGIRGLYT